MTNATNISERVMLASLNISRWSARAFDTKATREVQSNHQAEKRDIGRFNKKLLPENAKSYEAVASLEREMRAWFYEVTIPYDKMGVRLLPAALYLQAAEKIRAYRDAFDTGVNAFIADYAMLKEEARSMLNGLFNESNYPDEEELRGKFGIQFAVLPFPDAAQYKIGLPPEVVEEIRSGIQADAEKAIKEGVADIWGRVLTTVGKVVERLSIPDAIFRSTLISNVGDLAALLPALNITKDPALDEIAAQLTRLAANNPDRLRQSTHLRAKVADEAQAIVRKVRAMTGSANAAPIASPIVVPDLFSEMTLAAPAKTGVIEVIDTAMPPCGGEDAFAALQARLSGYSAF